MHIIVKCEDMIIARVLINNGLALMFSDVHFGEFECGYISYPPYQHDHQSL